MSFGINYKKYSNTEFKSMKKITLSNVTLFAEFTYLNLE